MSWWESAPLAQQGQPKPLIDLRDPSKAEDQQMQREANERAARAEERAIAAEARLQAGQQVPAALFEKANSELSQYTTLKTALDTFKDDYAGNFAGGIENTAQAYLDVGTPGQRDWWAQFKAADNQIRNDLFGSALTAPEKAAYEATTISPGMASNQIKINLQKRSDLIRKAVNRRKEFYMANGFRPDAINAIYSGIDLSDSATAPSEQKSGQARDPDMEGGLAVGTNITFAGDDGNGFDRKKWLMETTGFDPNGEANLVAWLSLNSGNPNITKADVADAYKRFSEGRSSGLISDEDLAELRAGKQRPFQGFDSTFAENQFNIRAEQLAQERDTTGGAVDAFGRGLFQVPTLGLYDKAQALSDTVIEGGTYAENMDQQRLINTADDMVNTYASTGGELLGAILTPYGRGARTPMQLAKVAGVTSGATEFNQSSAPYIDRVLPTALATATGGLMGYGTGKAVEYAAPFVSSVAQRIRGNAVSGMADDLPAEMSAPEFIAAAQRRDIDYLPADIPGAYGTQIATSITDKTLGSKFIQEGAKQSVNSVQNAVRRTTDALGGAPDNVGAGQAAQRGVNAWQEAVDAKVTQLEDAVPINPNQDAVVSNSVAVLEDIANRFSSNSELAQVMSDGKLSRFLTSLRGREEDVATGILDASGNPITRTQKFGGSLSYQDLREFRTEVGQMLGRPTFQSDIPQQKLKALYAGLTQDIEQTAMKVGPKALEAFLRANRYKRSFESRREKVMGLLLGKKLDMSPEQTFAQLQSWGKKSGGDFSKLSRAIRSLPDNEANAVRATIIDSLGKATDGAQNASGTVFSPNTFATQWNKLSPRAKAVLFQGEHRAALDDIAGVSTSIKRAGRYNNNSNTGVMVGGTATIGTILTNPVYGAALLAVQGLSGAILGSPRLAKWVAALYKKPNEKAVMAHIARLDNLAKAEPIIANNVFQLQTRLRDAITASPDRLAANPGEEKGTPLPTAKTTTAGEPQ
jgi:hypothetical protein